MWHASTDNLERWLIKNECSDGKKDSVRKIISKVFDKCFTCKKINQPHGRQKDCGLSAEFPNEIVVPGKAFLKDEDTGNKYPFCILWMLP